MGLFFIDEKIKTINKKKEMNFDLTYKERIIIGKGLDNLESLFGLSQRISGIDYTFSNDEVLQVMEKILGKISRSSMLKKSKKVK